MKKLITQGKSSAKINNRYISHLSLRGCSRGCTSSLFMSSIYEFPSPIPSRNSVGVIPTHFLKIRLK